MKSTERHDLATNELADVLARFVKRIKPFVGYAAVTVIVIVVVVFWNSRHNEQTRAARERDAAAFSAALSVSVDDAKQAADRKIASMEGFLAEHKGSAVQRLAESCLAGEYSNRAVQRLLGDMSDKEVAAKVTSDLDQARRLYESLSKGDDQIAVWAAYSLACLEATEADLDMKVARVEWAAARVKADDAATKVAQGHIDAAGQKAAQAENRLIALAASQPGSSLEMIANQRLQAVRHTPPLVFDKEVAKPPVPPVKIEKIPAEGKAPAGTKSEGDSSGQKPAAPPATGASKAPAEGAKPDEAAPKADAAK